MAATAVCALILAFAQAPGRTVADTKFDLTQNPFGFLSRAAHLWNSDAPLGQVQNQAYGYFFPHGAFFSLGHLVGLPGWVTQRVWWALLLLAGFWGIIRLSEALGIGSRGARIIAALAFTFSPRVLTTLGSISSETLPMMLAPWMLLAPVALAAGRDSGVRVQARSALALALMGAVNAVATFAAALPALLWWATSVRTPGWRRFSWTWLPLLALAVAWWTVPLLILGKVSPPFLDYIESSGVTTEWASLPEVLRGTSSWTPFVSPERIAGAVLVTQPAAVLATGLIAAAGMAGLAMRSMPARGRLVLVLLAGLAGLCAGYAGDLANPHWLVSPVAGPVRVFLDSAGAPLRNVHKLEPLIRIPLILGLAHLLAQVPLPFGAPIKQWRSAFAHPERNPVTGLVTLVLVALALATSLAWTGKLAPRGAYEDVPQYWHEAADWLSQHSDGKRALVVPGAPFAIQTWGLTRDEPLQALASTPWAVRDAVPLNPPGAIRALDSVQRLIAAGRPSPYLANALAKQGIGYVVVRNDLDPETSRSARPLMVHESIGRSPGLAKVAQFGEQTQPPLGRDLVSDGDLHPGYPAVEIYAVSAGPGGLSPPELVAGPGAPANFAGAAAQYVGLMPIVAGGAESLLRLNLGGPALLASDAVKAGVPVDNVIVTDTPADRETDFGQVDDHSSAFRAAGDPRRTHNLVADYPGGQQLVRAQWSGARVSVSSSAADATQIGGAAPASSAWAAVDGDPATAWISRGIDRATGQWLRLDLDKPLSNGLIDVTTTKAAVGAPVSWLEVRTAAGTTTVQVPEPGVPVRVALPLGRTGWVKISAVGTEDGSRGAQFGISELRLTDHSDRARPVPVPITRRIMVPPPPAGAAVSAWDLGQELAGRSACFAAPDRVRCSKGLVLAPEEPGLFTRTIPVPAAASVEPGLTVRARPGPALEALLTDPRYPVARGAADVGDLRGAAFAATDGDPGTSWIAPEAAVRDPAGPKPTITLELPAPTWVTGVRVENSKGLAPAPAAAVSVNLGDGPQVRQIAKDGSVQLHPRLTDRVQISIQEWKTVLDKTAVGFVLPQPPGLAEVTILGAGGKPLPAPANMDRRIEIGCDRGPLLTIGGQQARAAVSASARELRDGEPVRAKICREVPDAGAALRQAPIPLAAGQIDVAVQPGELFSVDRLTLTNTMARAGSIQEQAGKVLVLPLSVNPGWRARSPDGDVLQPITVNGWQQGWLLAGDGPVAISFAYDRWYRLGIFGGLLLLIPLGWLALCGGRSLPGPAAPPPGRLARLAGRAGLLAAATVIAGPIAAAMVLMGLAALTWWPRSRAVLAAVAGAGTAVAVAVLSTGPWRAPQGYLGWSGWAQLPALAAVIAVGLAALATSQRSSHRRAGSSTNE